MAALVQDLRSTPVDSRARSAVHVVGRLLVVAGIGFVLGAATSFAQTFLPDSLRPFANSASGWTLLTAAVVAACRARTTASALYGAASFVALVLGYQLMSTMRGLPTSETLFLVVGVIVGPFVGAAASWLLRTGMRAGIGCGALAGIALGEGAYGLLVVSPSTGWFYWTLIGAVGLGLLITTLVRRIDTMRAGLATTGLTALVAIAFFFAYDSIGRLAL